MDVMAVTQRAIDALTRRVERMAYKEGGTRAERDAFFVNRMLRAYWQDAASSLSPAEELEISLKAEELIKRTRLESAKWYRYQAAHSDQVVALSTPTAKRPGIPTAKTISMTWREYSKDQIARIKQDLYDRERTVKQALSEGSRDPLILFHMIERLEILEVIGMATVKDIEEIQAFDTALPDWRNRLEAVYYSNLNRDIIVDQFGVLPDGYIRPDDHYEVI